MMEEGDETLMDNINNLQSSPSKENHQFNGDANINNINNNNATSPLNNSTSSGVNSNTGPGLNSNSNNALKKNPKDMASPRNRRTNSNRRIKSKTNKKYGDPIILMDSNVLSSPSSANSSHHLQLQHSLLHAASLSQSTSQSYSSHGANNSIAMMSKGSSVSTNRKSSVCGTAYLDSSINDNIMPITRSDSVASSKKSTSRSRTKPSTKNDYQDYANKQEQHLFEQRLCFDTNGVAVRKIHSNGKSQLRYVKCVRLRMKKQQDTMSKSVPADLGYNHKQSKSSSRTNTNTNSIVPSSASVSSLIGFIGRKPTPSKLALPSSHDGDDLPPPPPPESSKDNHTNNNNNNNNSQNDPTTTNALVWGVKKRVQIPLDKFLCVRKGKTTSRTKRNTCHANRLLSLITSDPHHSSLDIEAPTEMDRDKFAKAFSVFLQIPLLSEEDAKVVVDGIPTDMSTSSSRRRGGVGGRSNAGSIQSASTGLSSSIATNDTSNVPYGNEFYFGSNSGRLLTPMIPSPSSSNGSKLLPPIAQSKSRDNYDDDDVNVTSSSITKNDEELPFTPPPKNSHAEPTPTNTHNDTKTSKSKAPYNFTNDEQDDDADSRVSSLTHGFDQEIVEELHQALNELRAELESSRAEAARAVKVAEQAIQSAESCSSKDWNSTVTHKAAEVAAQAQKKSAEAIAKQRVAEERLLEERKCSAFWRRQAEKSQDSLGLLQTRVAAAEAQRVLISEKLESDKLEAAFYVQTLKRDFALSENIQRENLASSAEQNRLLEMELDGTRRDLESKAEELKVLQELITDMKNDAQQIKSPKKKLFGSRSKSKKFRGPSLLETPTNGTSSSFNTLNTLEGSNDNNNFQLTETKYSEQLLQLQAQSASLKKQFQLLRRTTNDELQQLPGQAFEWVDLVGKKLTATQGDVAALRNRLSEEVSMRRKLMNELHDLRGTVRVFVRPRPPTMLHKNGPSSQGIISVVSHEVGLLHKDSSTDSKGSKDHSKILTFEYDRMFTQNSTQHEIFADMESLIMSSLEGYNSCIMAYGQSGCGKTSSLIGDFEFYPSEDDNEDSSPEVDIKDYGVFFLSVEQLLAVSEKRADRFRDSFSITMVEINDEKLIDLVSPGEKNFSCVDTEPQDKGKRVNGNESKRLEIKTNHDGETVVQGLKSIQVSSVEEVKEVWQNALLHRRTRLVQQNVDPKVYDASCHIITTLQIKSLNIATGVHTMAKIEFVDLASSDVVPRRSALSQKSTPTDNFGGVMTSLSNSNNEFKFVNKSLSHLLDVVNARAQYSRSVPYRNSTLTHLLRDSLEGDTKVLLLACVSSDAKDIQQTAVTMRFASKMREIVIGKATKHITSVQSC